ncbi:DUF6249 domain-containing protein [Gaoshiqia sp. Z1-71]|uniref:DUF6249 domain-containing protein n=1 Tax=Gaoshiqia hydrogeniformans TaxID=3290090 RepID=UPI003BF86A8B
MNEAIVIPVSFFAFIFAMWYVYISTRNKERMALIEKGADASLFNARARGGNFLSLNYFLLKIGFLFMGIAVGVLFGNILDMYSSLESGTAYVSMIFLMGGFGLVAGHWYHAHKEKGKVQE